MNIQIIQHESFEAPGAITDWAQSNQHAIRISRVYQGDALPSDCNDFDCLIILGGPQSPATTREECAHFDAPGEIALIKKAIADDKAILGICLGAQLIGEAYGSPFEKSPHKEIDVFPIQLTTSATSDPIFSKFPNPLNVGHWHADMPGVPDTAVILAKSEGCPRQIVQFDRLVYGFQCHFEFTNAAVQGMLAHCMNDIYNAVATDFVMDVNSFSQYSYDSMNALLFQFLDYLAHPYQEIDFKPFSKQHIALWEKWVRIPHVKATWFIDGYEDIHYIHKKIEGNGYDYPYVIEIDKKSIGYIQCSDLFAYKTLCQTPEGVFTNESTGTFCVDLFIAEESHLNKGYGTQIIKQFTQMIFDKFNAKKILIDPASTNKRAIRCYEKAGFQFLKLVHDGVTECHVMELLNKGNES